MKQVPSDAQCVRILRNFPPFVKQQFNVRDCIIEPDSSKSHVWPYLFKTRILLYSHACPCLPSGHFPSDWILTPARFILFHFLCTQHVSDINISIVRSWRLCCWITTSVVLSSVHCVLEIWCLQHGHYWNPAAPNLQHTMNREQNNRCGNSTTQSQAPDNGYINIRNMLST